MASQLKLKPVRLGHNGFKEESRESHFDLTIVGVDAFERLSVVKRHKLFYLVLGNTMQKIHALSVKVKSPSEGERRECGP